jgi:ribose transport system substrate-binding protein
MNAANIPVVNITDRVLGGSVSVSWDAMKINMALNTGRFLLQKLNGRGNVIILEGVGGSETAPTASPDIERRLRNSQRETAASQPAIFSASRRLE